MNQQIKNIQYLLAFNQFQKIGPKKIQLIENYFSNLEEAFNASAQEFEKAGLHPNIINQFIDWRTKFSLTECLNELRQENINFISWYDQKYPSLLLEIPVPPPILYYKGDIGVINNVTNHLAVVGSRLHSGYANKVLSKIIPELVENNIIIVSGLAYGIDTLAHQETLNHKGITIAVLGSGLIKNNIYPYANRKLADDIIKGGGLLLSEFPPKSPPLKQNFPQRNRIIAGLCQGTIVIESKSKSGALITAYQALDQNREVLAVPGNIFSEFSDGPNSLIKKGAKLVLCSDDILEIYRLNYSSINLSKSITQKESHNKEKLLTNESEKIIYQQIMDAYSRGERIDVDKIVQNTKLDTATINSTLSILEIQDLIKNEFGSYSIS